MQYEIVLTTAEDIVGVVDAALAGKDICDIQYISEFADISEQQAQNAIKMAVDMELLYFDSASQSYKSDSLLSHLLVSARNYLQKATIMRFILEQYKPFKSFKDRYIFTQSIDLACKQLKVLYGMTTTYRDIKNTITNIATYAKAMISDGANQFVLNDDQVTYLEILDVVLKSKANDDNALKTLLGEIVYNYIDADKVYKNGLLQYSSALGSVLSKKHRGMIDYIGQVRNAADHGADVDEGGRIWEVSEETARVYPTIVATVIKDIVLRENGTIYV